MKVLGLTRRRFLEMTAAAMTSLAAASSRTHAQGTKVLRVRSSADIQDIDPSNPAASEDQDVMMAVFNKLVSYKTGTEWGWELEAATSIEQVDPTHVKFTLMPGVMWTNGFGEMTTEDVKYSFERLNNADFTWTYVDWQTLKEVEIVDKYNGVITLKEPFAPLFNSTLPYGSGTIICKKAVEALPEKKFTTDPPATCGPYKIKSWAPKQKMVLARHDGWPGPKPDFDEVEIYPIEDGKAAEVAFEAGELDMTGVAVSSIPRYREKLPAGTKFIEREALVYEWIGMNVEHPPFNDERVRKAVQLTIDVSEILQAAFGGAPRATGVVAPGLIGHRERNLIEKPDLDQAKKLLAEAGFANGFKTRIDTQNTSDHLAAVQVMQAQLAQVGIQAEINSMDSGTFWTLGIEADSASWKDIQIIYNRYSMAPDPFWGVTWFTPSQVGIYNWERWNSKEFGDLDKAGVLELDPAKRGPIYTKMQDMMEQSGAYIFVTHGANAFIHRDTIVPAIRPDGGNHMFRKYKTA